MRVAQVSPLYESCPPRFYGGTERVVHYLTEELVRLGHDVTLFASGDSKTSARLRAGCEQALRFDARCMDPLVHHIVMLDRIRRCAADFDVLHFHTEYLHFPWFADLWDRTLTTLHGRLDWPDLPIMMREYRKMPLISISDAQRAPIPWANWRGTVLHGLPRDLYRLGSGSGDYLAFLGRISPDKGVSDSIDIAHRVGMPLKIAAKIDPTDRAYFDEVIAPTLNDPLVEYVGEIGEADKGVFLGEALAVLFPIRWPEPFGLVMIEAMATGTPVIAFPQGSVREIIEDGVTGIVVDNVNSAVASVPRAASLDRAMIRKRFEARFSAERMAQDYLSFYKAIHAERSASLRGTGRASGRHEAAAD